jgi:hypothetical protein
VKPTKALWRHASDYSDQINNEETRKRRILCSPASYLAISLPDCFVVKNSARAKAVLKHTHSKSYREFLGVTSRAASGVRALQRRF